MRICTVLPTYNERANIVPLIHRLLATVKGEYGVVVVDDESPDGTAAAVQDMGRAYNSSSRQVIHLYQRRGQRGLTSAIQYGIDLAIEHFQADIVTWMDCDLSMPPERLPALLEPILEGEADLVIGSRWIEGGDDQAHGLMARMLSRLINGWAVLQLGSEIRDYTSGFVAARAEVLRAIRLQGDYGEYCIDLLGRAIRQGFRVEEVPYVCVPRVAGESKTGLSLWDYLYKGRKYVRTIWHLSRE